MILARNVVMSPRLSTAGTDWLVASPVGLIGEMCLMTLMNRSDRLAVAGGALGGCPRTGGTGERGTCSALSCGGGAGVLLPPRKGRRRGTSGGAVVRSVRAARLVRSGSRWLRPALSFCA